MKIIIDMQNKQQTQAYEKFVSEHQNGNFMQSLKWAEVKSNWKSEAVAVTDEAGNFRAAALVLIKKWAGQTFLYCPHGPVCDYNGNELLELTDALRQLAEKYNAYQFKIDPCIRDSDTQTIENFRSLGFSFTPDAPELSTIQARNNYMLFFNGRTKEEIFASFHKKWRYNIRVAEKHGVQCRVCGKEALDDFYSLMKETGKRDGFCIRGKKYFARMLDCLGENCMLYICYLHGVPLSGAVCVRYAGKSCYVYGASSSRLRNVMPNYLMQWRMICDALESGCTVHDFQGIPFYNDETHPNYGVYRFKRGFSGEIVTYAGEFDWVFKPIVKRISDFAAACRCRVRMTVRCTH